MISDLINTSCRNLFDSSDFEDFDRAAVILRIQVSYCKLVVFEWGNFR